MSRRHLAMLFGLGAIWGASFMLLKIALRDLEPTTVIFFRIASAGVTLALAVAVLAGGGRALREVRERWRDFALLGLVNTSAPFLLLTWGQQYIDTGVAAILNASAPIFAAVLAIFYAHSERVTGTRALGIGVGFGGIVLLIGFEPTGGARAVAGSVAVVAAALFYAIGALYTGKRLTGVSPLGIAVGSMLFATLYTAPFGLAQLPDGRLTASAIASTVALGAVCTGVAYLLYFGLIMGAGASRAILVTYLVPSMAIVYGVTLLGEHLALQSVVGLVLVLFGVALGTGALQRRPAPAPVDVHA